MDQHISQDEIRRIIISDMVKKRNVFDKPNTNMLACMLRREKRRMKSNSIVPVIGKDTIEYKDGGTGKRNCTLPSKCVYFFGRANN